ncbi:hypothetical protein ACNSZH_27845 [Burkholderia gladioli]|uniref:hypothetical protein n=1 Tax=Burkholderia gladioli TaxID=28095 RepID=UPI003B97ED4E
MNSLPVGTPQKRMRGASPGTPIENEGAAISSTVQLDQRQPRRHGNDFIQQFAKFRRLGAWVERGGNLDRLRLVAKQLVFQLLLDAGIQHGACLLILAPLSVPRWGAAEDAGRWLNHLVCRPERQMGIT